MLVDIRATQRMRGAHGVDIGAALGPVLTGATQDSAQAVDPSRLRLVCDWIQYRNNFRTVLDVRPVLATGGATDDSEAIELALDLRRCAEYRDDDLRKRVQSALAIAQQETAPSWLPLEDWTVATGSCVWQFNALYWQALDLWEQATGRGYEQALPGGESDARNLASVRELLGTLFEVWDDLAARGALPEQLYVLELGVGNGNQASIWLDEFARLDAHRGSEYYRRLHYLMCDYSPHVLALARSAVSAHAAHVSAFVLDATDPLTALGFLRERVFLVYISNVYDNLPTEELAQIGGRSYRVQTRAYLPAEGAQRLAALLPEVGHGDLAAVVAKLLRLGPRLLAESMPGSFASAGDAVAVWQSAWAELRMAERYLPLGGVDSYEVTPGVRGEALRPLLEANGDIRMHANNGAVASFIGTLPLLHPYGGRLLCHDLFVTDTHQYRTGFRGPGKYEGSVVNWVNGPLLAHVGARRGFDVTFAPFAHRHQSNIVTMAAQVRE